MVHWNLGDNKFFQTLLSIWANFSSAGVWIVSIFLISNSSSLFSRFLRIVSRAPTTIGITASFMFHNSFCFVFFARSWYLTSFLPCLTLWSASMTKSPRLVLFFLLIKTRFDLVWIGLLLFYFMWVFHTV